MLNYPVGLVHRAIKEGKQNYVHYVSNDVLLAQVRYSYILDILTFVFQNNFF